ARYRLPMELKRFSTGVCQVRQYSPLRTSKSVERTFPRWTGPIPVSGPGYRPRGLEGKDFRLLGAGEHGLDARHGGPGRLRWRRTFFGGFARATLPSSAWITDRTLRLVAGSDLSVRRTLIVVGHRAMQSGWEKVETTTACRVQPPPAGWASQSRGG